MKSKRPAWKCAKCAKRFCTRRGWAQHVSKAHRKITIQDLQPGSVAPTKVDAREECQPGASSSKVCECGGKIAMCSFCVERAKCPHGEWRVLDNAEKSERCTLCGETRASTTQTATSAAKLYANNLPVSWDDKTLDACEEAFEDGAKWQREQTPALATEIGPSNAQAVCDALNKSKARVRQLEHALGQFIHYDDARHALDPDYFRHDGYRHKVYSQGVKAFHTSHCVSRPGGKADG